MSSLYRRQLENWLKKINIKALSVLDIGGGQLPIRNRVAEFESSTYKILDNDAQYKPDLFWDLNQPFDCWKEKDIHYCSAFNVIFCLEVFEYIWSPFEAHKTLYALLAEDGVAYISYPTIYPLHNPPGIDYLRYTKNAVEKLLGESGFRTWEITPRIATEGQGALSTFYSQEQMRPIRGTTEIFDTGYMVKCFK